MKIHFIGIGGIGTSALAQYYLEKGATISGSDLVSSEITENLEKKGVKIFIGKHKSKNLPRGVDLIIYSPAVGPDNPELLQAKHYKLPTKSYPEALGELTKKHFTIAVSGTHGKSTTTAMIGLLLTKAGSNPTVIVGTKLTEFGGSNCRVGKGKYLVIEADEHFASFLNYWPKIIVLTTIDKDHLDYYKNLKNIIKTFQKYILHLPKDGWLVANEDDKNVQKIIFNFQFSIFNKFSIFDYQLSKLTDTQKLKRILKIPGEHNISNALAALMVARILKIPDKISFKALSEYRGAWRRFEIHHVTYNMKHITLISDYAHHPTEIKATLKATREKFPRRKIWCVFQPHQYQRTFYLFDDFVKAFSKAPINKIIITDIYDVAGRENKEIKKKVSAKKLIEVINKKSIIYLPKNKIIKYLKKNIQGGEIVIIMGAGNIYKIISEFST